MPTYLSDLQREHKEWAERNFGPTHTLHNSVLGVAEEVGELAHAVLKRDQQIRPSNYEEDIIDACADIVIFLLGVANHEGFDLESSIIRTWEKVRLRDWNAERGGELG